MMQFRQATGSQPGGGAANFLMKTRSLQNILVPVDFSPMSSEAIAAAKTLAEETGAKVHLAHVHHAQYPVGFRGPVLSRSEHAVSFEEHRKEALAEDLQELVRRHGLARTSAVHLCEGASCLSRDLPARPAHRGGSHRDADARPHGPRACLSRQHCRAHRPAFALPDPGHAGPGEEIRAGKKSGGQGAGDFGSGRFFQRLTLKRWSMRSRSPPARRSN